MSDVARIAGVSVSTVSRALSGASGVSAATRAEIKRIAGELVYTISPDASRLATGQTRRVAVVVRDTETWFYYAILGAIEPVLRSAGYDVLFYRVSSEAERDAFFDELPARRNVDAVILVAVPLSNEQVERLGDMAVPIVIAGSWIDHYTSIHIDETRAARQAMNHLIQLGHRRIARIGITDPEGDPWQPDAGRDAGYRAALEASGIDFDPQLNVRMEFSLDGGARAMDQLLSLDEPPTAVFAFSDEVAIGAMRSLRRVGLHVPGDVSIVGVDDHPMAELSDLTTVRQPVREMGTHAARLVIDTLGGNTVEGNVELSTQLVVRGSTASPRGLQWRS
ncbi:LacI family transcriptional regulator [Agromyces intestinalis]|uniref:LacI family transcriptional regulator n=1 Tax=Agromyces intestinalis TaxID=2592652 RepID=A0A5C1YHB4_9MICO|nr:LacI family DNA-binding transcriptional regulator [Agromyces intestinalis]QEO15574.1 LacI family transcriptional regulator [Agromyces intestinalis]